MFKTKLYSFIGQTLKVPAIAKYDIKESHQFITDY